MKLCANLTLLYTEVPFLERFALAYEDGFRAVEIQFPYDTAVADIRAQLDEYELHCVLINLPAADLMQGGEGLACVPEREAEFEAALLECEHYAQELGVECVNVLPGRCHQPELKDAYLNTFYKNLKRAAERFIAHDITVTFEAINRHDMPNFLISTTDEILSVLENVPYTNVKAQLDIYHLAKMEQDIPSFLATHSEQVGHIQFADCPGRHEPGTGELNFTELFTEIQRSGYAGWLAAEYNPSTNTRNSLGWLLEL